MSPLSSDDFMDEGVYARDCVYYVHGPFGLAAELDRISQAQRPEWDADLRRAQAVEARVLEEEDLGPVLDGSD